MAAYWTARAFRQNRDFAERNIITLVSGDDVVASGDLVPAPTIAAASLVPWPDADALIAELNRVSLYPVLEEGAPAVDRATAAEVVVAANLQVADACQLQVWPVDVNGAVDPAGDPVLVHPQVRLGALVHAVGLYRLRVTAPEGALGMAEFGVDTAGTGLGQSVRAILGHHARFGVA